MNLKYINMKWIIALLLIFLSGCTVPFLNYEFGGKSVSGDDASGLIMNFDYGKPPTGRVLGEEEDFQVAVNLKNTGDREINGNLCVSDSLFENYGGIPDQECRYVSLGGAEEGVEAQEQKIYFPDSTEVGYEYYNLNPYFSQTNNIIASFEYEVDSNSGAQICVKRDIDAKLPSGISCPDVEIISSKCSEDGRNVRGCIQNMNVPIVISSIEKDVVSSGGNARVKVEITLKKITDGEIEDEDIVDYDVGFSGAPSFNCGSRSGQLLFDKNEKVIKCNTNLNIGQDYINQLLEVRLHYKFKKLITTQFELRKEEQ